MGDLELGAGVHASLRIYAPCRRGSWRFRRDQRWPDFLISGANTCSRVACKQAEDTTAELTSAAARPIDCQGDRQRRRCRGLVTPACIRLSPLLLLLRLPLTLLLLFTR